MMINKIFCVLTVAALALGLCACASNQPIDAGRDSENIPDWAGVYSGVIPSASGSGINVTITLRNDLTCDVQYQYIDRPEGDFTFTGTFKWNEAGNVITMEDTDIPPHYQIGENRLIQLDMEGNPITGMLADNYVLKKQ